MFEIIGFIVSVVFGIILVWGGLVDMEYDIGMQKLVSIAAIILGLIILYGYFVNMPFDMGGW